MLQIAYELTSLNLGLRPCEKYQWIPANKKLKKFVTHTQRDEFLVETVKTYFGSVRKKYPFFPETYTLNVKEPGR
jgi:hypothetical protein